MQNKVPDHSTVHSAAHGSPIAWLGLDAHAKSCVLAQLDDDGTQRQFWRIPTQAEKLVTHVQAIAARDKRLALEESNLARWLWQLLRPHVAQLVVCDARHAPAHGAIGQTFSRSETPLHRAGPGRRRRARLRRLHLRPHAL